MIEFQLKTNDYGEYCVENLSDQLNYGLKDLSRYFNKRFITENELRSFLQRKEKRVEVKQFSKNLEKYEWITRAVFLMSQLNINLTIDHLFIKIWRGFEKKINIKIDSQLINLMGFCRQNQPNCEEIKCMLKFKEFLIINGIKFESNEPIQLLTVNDISLYLKIDKFKKCISLLNSDKSYQFKEYFNCLEEVFNEYRDEEYEKLKQKDRNAQVKIYQLEHANSQYKNFADNVEMRKKEGCIYIVTSEKLAMENLFKIGYTFDLPSYDQKLKRSSPDMYICYADDAFNVKNVVIHIQDALRDFLDCTKNDFFRIHWLDFKKFIISTIKNNNKPYDDVNNLIKNGITDMCTRPPIIPSPIKIIGEYKGIPLRTIFDEASNILKKYEEERKYKIVWKTLFIDINEKFKNKLKQKEFWNHFKKEFKWKSTDKKVKAGNKMITIEYFNK